MKKKITGFTLAEMLVAFGIIGVLVVAALVTIKPYDTDIRYVYSATFHSLNKAVYNSVEVLLASDPNRATLDPFSDTYKDNNLTNNLRTAKLLCDRLVLMLNTTSDNCSLANSQNNLIFNNTLDNADDDEFGQPLFTTTNGNRYWLSMRLGEGTDAEPYFFIIFVDMNGAKAPNSMKYIENEKDPDIFAFAVLNTYRICPLGPPEVDTKYLTTRISYYMDNGSDESQEYFSAPSQAYVKSKAEAWGYYSNNSDISTKPQERRFNDNYIMWEEPFSYNEYIRMYLNRKFIENKVYSGVTTQPNLSYDGANFGIRGKYFHTSGKYFNGTLFRGESTDAADVVGSPSYGCERRSNVECKVIVDKYIW